MTKYIAAYLATLIAFFALDFVWLGMAGNALYKPTLGDILLPRFNPAPAIAFYGLFAVGIVIFAVSPALAAGTWTTALVRGALFGFFAYGTYDMTNMATLRNWALKITIADMLWGTLLTGASASIGYGVTRIAARLA